MVAEARFLPSWRLGIGFLQLLGLTVVYMNRVNISFAVVCMTKPPGGYNTTDGSTDYSNSTSGGLQYGNSNATFSSEGQPEFDWDRKLVGFILGSFYIGYILTHIPGGWAATKISAKWLIVWGASIAVITSFLSPVAARAGWGYLVAMQIIKGLGCGVYYPATQLIIANWAAPHERSRMVAIALAGAGLGSLFGFFSAGFLCTYGFAGGWPSIFYVYGIVASIWLILYILLAHESPVHHPYISNEERQYIQRSKGESGTLQENRSQRVPWKSIVTSLPFIAINAAGTAFCWLWYVVLTSIPIYLNDVLKLNINNNGVASAMPYVLNVSLGICASYVADKLIQRNVFTVTVVRKLAVSCAMLLPAIFIISVGFLKSHHDKTAVTLISLAVGCLAFARVGNHVNMIDIAPRFSSILMGIDNMICNLTGFLAPLITGFLTSNGTQEEWRHVFFLAGGVSLVAELIYLIFGSAELQPWAKETTIIALENNDESLNYQAQPLVHSSKSDPKLRK